MSSTTITLNDPRTRSSKSLSAPAAAGVAAGAAGSTALTDPLRATDSVEEIRRLTVLAAGAAGELGAVIRFSVAATTAAHNSRGLKGMRMNSAFCKSGGGRGKRGAV